MLSHTHSPQYTRYLLRVSLALYFFSLFLPAYGEHLFDIEGEHYYFGIEVLLFGLLFGWLGLFGEIGALAAYANLFYGFAMYQAYKKDTIPIKSTVITLILSMLSCLNREYTGDRGISFGDYISIWGWGSVLWFFAIGILVIVVIGRYYRLKLPKIRYVVIIFLALILGLIILQSSKLRHMNDKGIERFSSPSIAYMRLDKELLEYHPLPHSLKPYPLVAIEGDFDAVTGSFGKWYDEAIAMPSPFVFNGMLWQRYNLCFDEYCQVYQLTPTTQTPDYQYTVKSLRDKGRNKIAYQLIKDNKSIWQATSQMNGLGSFPNYKDDLMVLFEQAGLTQIQQLRDNFKEQIIDFTQSPSCKIDNVFTNKNLIQIKGQLFHTRLPALDSYRLWCSGDYYLMIPPQVKLDHQHGMNIAVIFDKNLTPLQQFIWREHQTNLLMANTEWDKLSSEQQDAIKKDVEQSPDITLIQQISIMPNPYHPPVNDYYGSVIVAKTALGSFYYRRR